MGIPSNLEQKLGMAKAWKSVVALEDSPVPKGWGQEAGVGVTGSGLYIVPPLLKKGFIRKPQALGLVPLLLRHHQLVHQLGTKINTC